MMKRWIVVVDGRLENDEQCLVVRLQLRSLMRFDGVLYGQFVEVVFEADLIELLLVGLVQPDPREGAGSAILCQCAVQFERIGVSFP